MIVHNRHAAGISIGRAKPGWVDFHIALIPKHNPNYNPGSKTKLRRLFPFVYLVFFTKPKMGKVLSGYEVWEDHGCCFRPSRRPLSTWRVPFYYRGVVDRCHEWTSIFIGRVKESVA